MHFSIYTAPPEQWIILAAADVVMEPRGVIHDQTFISGFCASVPIYPRLKLNS